MAPTITSPTINQQEENDMKNDLKSTKPKTREEWLARFTEAARRVIEATKS